MKGKMWLAFLIGIMPTSKIRILLYRIVLGYQIHNAYIGWRTIIVVDEAELTECKIGANNRFVGPMKISIEKGASIGDRNTFSCGIWTKEKRYENVNYARSLKIRENSLITSRHHFDVVGAFTLGCGSWIAGCDSQFWTHGAGAEERDVTIGDHCYIGSAVRFSPGVSIGDNNIVGLGSVVTKALKVKDTIVAGQPAKVVRENYDWKTRQDILQ